MTVTRDAFLEAVADPDQDVFIQLMKDGKSGGLDISELLGSCTKHQLEALWTQLQCKCSATLLSLSLDRGDTEQQQQLECAARLLQHIISLAITTISLQPVFVPDELFQTAVVLHGILLSLPADLDRLGQSISRLCEAWWVKELSGREELTTHTVLYLLRRTLQPKATVADVKRLCQMRCSLKLMNFHSATSDTLKSLLQNAFISTVYLKCEEGRRFLSYVFNLNVDFVDALHKTIKNQLPVCPASLLQWYGQIYFKAWHTASGPFIAKVEVDCIQDLMFHAVHAGRGSSRSLSLSLRKVLGYFHKQKKQRGVDEMLQRLYEPFLWRSLKVANGNVRANAAALLVDAFPLIDPDLRVTEIDERMQQQFDIIERLLLDPVVAVRCTMIQGVCRICDVFWELIPIASVRAFLLILVRHLACDAASADVRIAVIKGFCSLLGNHLCHPLLKTLLPELRNLLHDTSEKVRVAFMDLLLKIKNMRFLKFWTVAPIEHLLSRLETDEGPVARRVVHLVFASYMPLDRDLDDQLTRCVALIQANPSAARRFYQYAPRHMSLAQTADFISLVCRCVLICVRREAQRNGNINESDSRPPDDLSDDLDQPEKENETGDEGSDELTPRDVPLMSGLVDTIVILWCAISAQLQQPGNETLKKQLQTRFSFALPELFKAFDDCEIISSLIMLAGFLPPAKVPTFSRTMLSKLRSLPTDSATAQYATMLESMCKWDKTRDLIEMIDSWLSSALEVAPAESPTNNKVRKRVGFSVPDIAPRPALALTYLTHLMRHHVCREVILLKSRDQLRQLSLTLSHVLPYLERRFAGDESLGDEMTDSVLLETFEMYCKLQVILHNPEGCEEDTALITLEAVLQWTERHPLRLLRSRRRRRQQRRLLNRTDATLLMEPDATLLMEPDATLMTADATALASADTTALLSQTLTQTRSFTDGQLAASMELASELVTRLSTVCANTLLVGVGDHQLASHIAQFALQLVQLDNGSRFVSQTCQLMYQISEWTLSSETTPPDRHDEGIGAHDEILPGMLGSVIEMLAALVQHKREHAVQLLPNIRPVFSEVLSSYYKYHSDKTASKDVMASIMAATVAEITSEIKKNGEFERRNSVSELPPLTSFLLSMVTKSSALLSLFLDELRECIASGAVNDLEGVLACLQLVHTISTGKCCLSELTPVLQSIATRVESEDLSGALPDAPIRELHTSGVSLLKECMTHVGVVI